MTKEYLMLYINWLGFNLIEKSNSYIIKYNDDIDYIIQVGSSRICLLKKIDGWRYYVIGSKNGYEVIYNKLKDIFKYKDRKLKLEGLK